MLSDNRWRLSVRLSGLYGVASVLPAFMNQIALSQETETDFFCQFLAVFENRIHHLRYVLWKQTYLPLALREINHPYLKTLGAISRTSSAKMLSVAGYLCVHLKKQSLNVENLVKVARYLLGIEIQVAQNELIWRRYRQNPADLKGLPHRLGSQPLGGRFLDARRNFSLIAQIRNQAQLEQLLSGSDLDLLEQVLKRNLPLDMEWRLWVRLQFSNQNAHWLNHAMNKTRLGWGFQLGENKDTRLKKHLLVGKLKT